MVVTNCLVALAGGAGAALRLAVNAAVHRRVRPSYPVAMSMINVIGSFVLGFVSGLAMAHFRAEEIVPFVGTGLVGGFTAFSTTSFQTLRLLQERKVWLAVANSFGMLIIAVLFAGLGLWFGLVL